MLPNKNSYPYFVPDQLLTSENLNSLFGYLDEQGRLTRTNLLGIGIVCGLEVKPSSDGTSITITKGTGVTSDGYLVSIPETTYTQYKIYDPTQEKTYDKFLSPPNQHFWQLFETATEQGTQSLTTTFLNGNGVDAQKKVVLLFVELLEIDNKNCNPNSCDDKGVTVEVNIRPILVEKSKTAHLLKGTISTLPGQKLIGVKPLQIKRFDVPSTSVASSKEVFDAFLRLMDKSFLNDLELTFSEFWQTFKPILDDEYQKLNPFGGFSQAYKDISNKNLSWFQLLHIQYYYDFFCDLIKAYDELRATGLEVLTICTPNSDLFPRHLMLDLALPVSASYHSNFRHYFVPSPLFQHQHLHLKLKSLFRRLVLMIKHFAIPSVQGAELKITDPYQRITPSRLGPEPISKKAIPYYYVPNQGATPLYQEWNIEKTLHGEATLNLSYHANKYAGITAPLENDLEPYNFLRVEGIIGKSYTKVLSDLKSQIQKYRLGVDVIALNTEVSSLQIGKNLEKISVEELTMNLGDMHCYFNDIDAMYSAVRREILCLLCQELRYYYEIPLQLANLQLKAYSTFLNRLAEATDKDLQSQVPLFEFCTNTPYQINKTSLGTVIEEIYLNLGKNDSLTAEVLFKALEIDTAIEEVNRAEKASGFKLVAALSAAIGQMLPILEIPILIIKLSELLTEDLHDFDVEAFCRLHAQIANRARSFKKVNNQVDTSEKESIRKKLYTKAEEIQVENAKSASDVTAKTEAKEIPKNLAAAVEAKQITDADLEIFEIRQKEYVVSEVHSQIALARAQAEIAYEDVQVVATTQNNIGAILLFLFVVEDLYDHLDVLIYSCKCNVLKGIKQEYERRAQELLELRQLGNFSKRHPGIEHKAGVPIGGTFILVYHTPSNERRTLDDRAKIGRIIKDKLKLQELIEQIPEGTVIADFYLPYLCYSNCPPIVFNIQEVEEIPIVISLSLQNNPITGKNTYDVSDENSYIFNHSPETGTLNNGTQENGVQIPAPNEYYFVPALLVEKIGNQESLTLSFSFTSEGQTSQPVSVIVYNTPTAEITVTPNESTIAVDTTLKFEGSVNFADQTSWYVKDENGTNLVSNALSLGEWAFEKPGTYEISLVATQSLTQASSDPATVTIVVVEKPSAVISSEPNVEEKPEVPIGTEIQFKAEVKDADKVEWYENGTLFEISLELPPKEYKEAGEYKVRLKAYQSATGETVFSNELGFRVVGDVTAKITSQPEITEDKPIEPGTIVTFNGVTEQADIFRWTRNNNFVSSKKENVKIQFEKAGLEVIKFEAKNSSTGSSASDVLNVVVAEAQENVCEQCEKVIQGYNQLGELDPENFRRFEKLVLQEWRIDTLLEALEEVCKKNADSQIEYFQGNDDSGGSIAKRIAQWLDRIRSEVVKDEMTAYRLLFLALYRVLSNLLMYIACLQEQDIDKAGIATLEVFQKIQTHLKGAKGLWALRKTTLKVEPQPLESLKIDFQDEITRLKSGDEQNRKPKYFEILNALVTLMK